MDYTYTDGELALSDRYYQYDDNRNIIRERSGTTSSGATREKYTYDSLNRLTRHDSTVQNKSYTYSYDTAGNILSKSEYAYTTDTLGSATDTVTYTYGDSTWGDLLTAYDGKVITYDEIGNMTSFDGKNYSWEGRQLKGISSETDTIGYTYNAQGIRTSKTVNGETTEYFVSGDRILAMKTGDDIMWFYYDSQGNRVGVNRKGLAYYYLYNLQGDVVGIVRATTGKLVATYKYDAWGNCTVTSAEGFGIGEDNPFRYRGYYYDAESGFYYLNSRYYNPEVGRFINADSQINSDILGANLYAYCSDNPVNRIDNQGTFWDAILDIGFAACSAWQVLKEPKNPANWAALAADLACLVVPGATGGGAAVRAASKSR